MKNLYNAVDGLIHTYPEWVIAFVCISVFVCMVLIAVISNIK